LRRGHREREITLAIRDVRPASRTILTVASVNHVARDTEERFTPTAPDLGVEEGAVRSGRRALQTKLGAEVGQGVRSCTIGEARECVSRELGASERDTGRLEALAADPARGGR
jgi:hypothetical protein